MAGMGKAVAYHTNALVPQKDQAPASLILQETCRGEFRISYIAHVASADPL